MILKPFVYDTDGNASAAGEMDIAGGTQMTGTIRTSNMEEVAIIAYEGFTKELVRDLDVEMVIRIKDTGFIDEGRVTVRGKDSQSGFEYEASCNADKGLQCGSSRNGKIDVKFHDGAGYIRFTIEKVEDAKQTYSGSAYMDGHTTELGSVSLKMKNSPPAQKSKSFEENENKK